MNAIGVEIICLSRTLQRLMDDNLKRHGLTSAQVYVLGYLSRKATEGEERCAQREIISRCGNTRAPTVTGVLQTMEQSGYICRSTGEDARTKYVSLTEKGKALSLECKAFLDEVESALCAAFSQDERDEMQTYFDRLKTSLQELEKTF